MKQFKNYFTPFITILFLLLFGHGVWGQTAYNMSTGNKTWDLSGTWSVNGGTFSGTDAINWASVGVIGTGSSVTTGLRTTKSSATIVTNTTGGLQKPSGTIQFLSTGTGTPEAVAIDLLLNFTGRIAGTLSFDWAAIDNGGTRPTSLRVFWSTDGITFTEILGAQQLDRENATSPSSGAVSNVLLPSNFNGSSTAILRFYNHAGSTTSGSGTRDKFQIDNITISSTATSTTYTTSWSNNSPTSSIDAIIDGDLISTADISCKNLTINAGKSLTISSADRLTVNGSIINNGTLTLESGATLVQGAGNTVGGSGGTFNVKQALTGSGGSTPSGRFWYLGSPVSGATSNVFNAAGINRLWTYSETALAYNTEINDNTTALSPMQGCVVRLGANETSIFTGGLLNTGDYTSSLTRTGTTDSKRGYTLLSNPYPSYLDWSAAYNAAVTSNANISSSIWYRSYGGSMVFDTYNATGSVAISNSGGTTTQYIPPMQAFWVYNPNDGTTGSLTFSNSMRSHQSNGGLKSSTDFPAFVRLNLENDGAIDQTVLYFDNNAAAGYDNFDSDKMMLANAAQVYTFVDNKKLAINGMKSVKANKQVPLTVEFPTAKSYSFNATEVAMIEGIVLLEDRLTKVFQDLTMNPVYEFEAAAGTAADRFVVHFQANGGVAGIETAEDNGIAIVSNATGLVTITLSEELPAVGTIQIIDANGKVIATQAINEQATTMNINAATGIYHVLVDTSSKIARKKIVITK